MLASGMDAHHFVPEGAYRYLTEIMNNQRKCNIYMELNQFLNF